MKYRLWKTALTKRIGCKYKVLNVNHEVQGVTLLISYVVLKANEVVLDGHQEVVLVILQSNLRLTYAISPSSTGKSICLFARGMALLAGHKCFEDFTTVAAKTGIADGYPGTTKARTIV